MKVIKRLALTLSISSVIISEGFVIRLPKTVINKNSLFNESAERAQSVRKVGFQNFQDDQNSGTSDPARNINFFKLKSVPVAKAALLGMALAALLPSLSSIGSFFGSGPQPYPPFYRQDNYMRQMPHHLRKRSIKMTPKPSRFDYDEEQLIDIASSNFEETEILLRDSDKISQKCFNDLHYVNGSCQETFLCKINGNLDQWNSLCNQALELAIETSEVSGMNLPLFLNERLFLAWKAGREGLECALVYNGCQKSVPQLLNAIGGLWIP